MRGFPKHLNTKQDYEYVRQNFPAEQWVPEFQKLLDTRYVWLPTGTVDSMEAGITDATHKVEKFEKEDGTVEYTQYELKLNEYAKIFQIGYSVDEVLEIIPAAVTTYVPNE